MPLAITPIATVTISNTTTQNVYFNSIPQTFTNLIIYGYGTGIIGNYFFGDMQFNGSNSSYGFQSVGTQGYQNSSRNTSSADRFFPDSNYVAWQGSDKYGIFKTTIFNYANPNTYPSINMQMGGHNGSSSDGYFEAYGAWYGGTGVNSIRLFTTYQGSNYFQNGTRFMLFGVN